MAKDKLDPRQVEFLKYYLDPKSDTFSDAYQSATRKEVGYSESYARTLISRELEWLSEIVKDWEMIKKAEKRLNEALDLKTKDEQGKVDGNLLKIVIDVAKFIAERLNKKKYSTKTEVEHSGEIEETIKLDAETEKRLAENYKKWLKTQEL